MKEDTNITNKTALPNFGMGQKFTAAFEHAFTGMAIADLQGLIILCNQSFCKITGYNAEELIGKKFLHNIHPEDVQTFTALWNDLLKRTANYVTIESRYQNKLMETVWVRNSFSLLENQEGIPENIMVICININEEKRAQQKAEEVTKRFRFLADTIPQQIWTADADGNLNYFSHVFYESSGLTSENLKDSNWINIVFPEDREITCQLWKQSIETGEEFIAEHRLRRRDGNFTWQLSRALAQRNNEGKIVLWVGSTTNIHNQKTMKEQLEKQVQERTYDLQQANFVLEHSNYDLEQFAYIATHDLQEPLRKIRTYSSLINKKYKEQLPEEAQDYMLKIENASEQMSTLIDNLLDYSLLLRPQEAFETIDLNVVLDHVLKDFDIIIKEKNAIFHYSNLPQLKLVPMQIYQLFYNLLSNALKFTSDDRKPVIDVTSRTLPLEEVIALQLNMDLLYTEIIFKDNGIGFRQEYAEKIFSIFQRLNNRRRFSGTGIGLALCKKIVVFHHGLIYAKATEDEGASFYIILPL